MRAAERRVTVTVLGNLDLFRQGWCPVVRGPGDRIPLPKEWWSRFQQQSRKRGRTIEVFCNAPPTISQKTLSRAKHTGWMSPATLACLAIKLGLSTETLLDAWRYGTPRPHVTAMNPVPSMGTYQSVLATAIATRLSWTIFHPVLIGGPLRTGTGVPITGGQRLQMNDVVIDCYDFGVATISHQIEADFSSLTAFAEARQARYRQLLDGIGDPHISDQVERARAAVAKWSVPKPLRAMRNVCSYVLSVVQLRQPQSHALEAQMLKLLACPSILVGAHGMDRLGRDRNDTEPTDEEGYYLANELPGDFLAFKYGSILHGYAAWSGVAFSTTSSSVASAIVAFESELQAVWWLAELLTQGRHVDSGAIAAAGAWPPLAAAIARVRAIGPREATPLRIAKEAIIATSRIDEQWRLAHE